MYTSHHITYAAQIKIWAVDKQAVASITRSSTYVAAAGTKPYAAHIVVEPVFSTATVHPNYVDCARFVGNTILSKSIVRDTGCGLRAGSFFFGVVTPPFSLRF